MKKFKYEDGSIAEQISEVEVITNDWNCDGQIYPIKGIWIKWENTGENEFISIDYIGKNNYFEPLN